MLALAPRPYLRLQRDPEPALQPGDLPPVIWARSDPFLTSCTSLLLGLENVIAPAHMGHIPIGNSLKVLSSAQVWQLPRLPTSTGLAG